MPVVHTHTAAYALNRLWNVTLLGWWLVIHKPSGTRGPHSHLLVHTLQLQLSLSQCDVYTSRVQTMKKGHNRQNTSERNVLNACCSARRETGCVAD